MQQVSLRSSKYLGLVALVDDEDFERVIQHTWWPLKRRHTFYAQARLIPGDRALTRLHRFIVPNVPLLDHKDGNGLNCQKFNLRDASLNQNQQNRPRVEGALYHPPYKGIFESVSQTNPWQARITVNGIRKHLGVFPTPEAAARAYDEAALAAFGEYAHTNF